MISAGSASMPAIGTPRTPRWSCLTQQTMTLPRPTGRWSAMAPGDPGDGHVRGMLADPAWTTPNPTAQPEVGGVPPGTSPIHLRHLGSGRRQWSVQARTTSFKNP